MSGGIILGSGGNRSDQDDDDRTPESRRVNVTNFLSLGHLTPWGGNVDVRRVPAAELKERFKDKRVDLFAYPDVELIRDMLEHEAMATGHMPQGTPEQREASFCDMVESAVKQMTGAHVRRTQKPKPAAKDRKTFFVQFFPQPTGIVGSLNLGNVWWELVTKELYAKPEAIATPAEPKSVIS